MACQGKQGRKKKFLHQEVRDLYWNVNRQMALNLLGTYKKALWCFLQTIHRSAKSQKYKSLCSPECWVILSMDLGWSNECFQITTWVLYQCTLSFFIYSYLFLFIVLRKRNRNSPQSLTILWTPSPQHSSHPGSQARSGRHRIRPAISCVPLTTEWCLTIYATTVGKRVCTSFILFF